MARFRREDFFGDPQLPLKEAVVARVNAELNCAPIRRVAMLSNLRYFGVLMNPLTCYYCFNADDELVAILAEVNNTPWNERHTYVLPCNAERSVQRIDFDKQFHVSPFNPMDIRYHWKSNCPGKRLFIHMDNWRNQQREFDATLQLRQQPVTVSNLKRLLWGYPFMTAKILWWIYWHALKLLVKRLPVYQHPGSSHIKGDTTCVMYQFISRHATAHSNHRVGIIWLAS